MNPKIGGEIRIKDSKVLESRESPDGTMIRRRRETADGKRFTTYERIEMPQLMVQKRTGGKEAFDRDKLQVAVRKSIGKFLNSELEVEEVVSSAMEILYNKGREIVSSEEIGEAVLEVLAEMNEVAYIRFASVFRKFKTLEEFEQIIKEQKKRGRRERKK